MAKKKRKKTEKKVKVEHKVKHKELPPETWNWVFVAVGAILIIGILAGVGDLVQKTRATPCAPQGPLTISEQALEPNQVAPDVAANKLKYLLETVNTGATVTIDNIETKFGLYAIDVTLEKNGRRISDTIYVSKNGEYLFGQAVNMTEVMQKINAPKEEFQPEKAEIPTVKFFVMAFCPFGQQAEKGLEPVYRLLKEKVNWEPHYVIYSNYAGGSSDYCIENGTLCSMHGVDELYEDVRQLCIKKYYDTETLWDYLKYVFTNCQLSNINTCWLSAAESAGIDTDKITECQNTEAVDLLKAEQALNKEYGVTGSPTVFINDKKYVGGRDPESYKTAICEGFTTQPDECGQELSTSSTGPAGQC
ncbi:MAG: DsbA family protein [Candidatus Diapherotrites archaeon]|nr:DsbA family protein [Candidatus Diapherotrites archaeon]